VELGMVHNMPIFVRSSFDKPEDIDPHGTPPGTLICSEEEIMEVESAEFNARIDPKTFEIEGLGLPVDRRVLDPGRFMKLWDGKRLVDTVFGK